MMPFFPGDRVTPVDRSVRCGPPAPLPRAYYEDDTPVDGGTAIKFRFVQVDARQIYTWSQIIPLSWVLVIGKDMVRKQLRDEYAAREDQP